MAKPFRRSNNREKFMSRGVKPIGGKIGGKRGRIGRNRPEWTTVNWLKRQERPIKFLAHNPKVGGSNPSPAIFRTNQRSPNRWPFFLRLRSFGCDSLV